MGPENPAGGAMALLIDLDGVIRYWDSPPVGTVEATYGLPPGAITATAFAAGLLEEAILGRITDEAWRQAIVERLATRYHPQAAREAVRAWSAPCGRVDPGVLALVRAVRQMAPVCLVTNATTRLDHDLEQLGIRHEFDAVISSARVGAGKPDPRIFHAALAAVDTPAARALFVDDTAGHVAAAQALGLHGHHFTARIHLETALQRAGLLPTP
ncbi:MAG TPA: HAD family phosphatase [Chloroflexota bacterium]|nr:HAD family phosphatase [Chloroflexota bacterium]